MTRQEAIHFYVFAKANTEFVVDSFKGYWHDRKQAFIDWCEYILEELNKLPDEGFDMIAFRKEHRAFEFPPPPEDDAFAHEWGYATK